MNNMSKRKFAQMLSPDIEQEDTYIKKLQRWTKEDFIPNFLAIYNDLKPILEIYKINIKFYEGILISIYLSICLSKFYKQIIEYCDLTALQYKWQFNNEGYKEIYKDEIEAEAQVIQEYKGKLLTPITELLEKDTKQSNRTGTSRNTVTRF